MQNMHQETAQQETELAAAKGKLTTKVVEKSSNKLVLKVVYSNGDSDKPETEGTSQGSAQPDVVLATAAAGEPSDGDLGMPGAVAVEKNSNGDLGKDDSGIYRDSAGSNTSSSSDQEELDKDVKISSDESGQGTSGNVSLDEAVCLGTERKCLSDTLVDMSS